MTGPAQTRREADQALAKLVGVLLENKVAVITGAGPGLGRTLTRLMAAEGARIAVAARRKTVLESIVDEVDGAIAVPADVTEPAAVQGLGGHRNRGVRPRRRPGQRGISRHASQERA